MRAAKRTCEEASQRDNTKHARTRSETRAATSGRAGPQGPVSSRGPKRERERGTELAPKAQRILRGASGP